MKDLELIIKRLSRISNLNSGGCGLAAFTIYEFLKMNGYKPTFVVIAKSYDSLNEMLTQWEIGNNFIHHVVVKLDNLVYDSSGAKTMEETASEWYTTVERCYELSDKEHIIAFKKVLKTPNMWNTYFNRDLLIHEVREINPLQLTLFSA